MELNLLSTQQAAERLGVDDSRVRQLILQGRLPAMRVGRAHLIRAEDLSLVKERKVGRPPKSQAAGVKPAKAAKKKGGRS
jgi:excisionase family DNA binding protein